METVIAYLAKNKEWIFSGIGVLVLSTIVAVVRHVLNRRRFGSTSPKLVASTETQSGTFVIPIEDREMHKIFYPRTFKRPPFLTVNCVDGKIGLKVKEQRPDGFLLETYIRGSAYGSLGGIKISWDAQGQIE